VILRDFRSCPSARDAYEDAVGVKRKGFGVNLGDDLLSRKHSEHRAALQLLKEAAAERAALTARIQELVNRLDAQRDKLARLRASIDKRDGRISTLEHQLTVLNARVWPWRVYRRLQAVLLGQRSPR